MSIQLYLPPTRYVVASLPLTDYRAAVECLHEAATDAESFVSLIRDKQEVTLMVAEDYWQNLSSQFPNAQARGDCVGGVGGHAGSA
ncbi:MAG TPA: hypothetical protein PK012_26070, partial [Blastocatellia bacterium]|nr:hypothetical protein [Blastocatellia bacterium]